jgi:hypothetical protein
VIQTDKNAMIQTAPLPGFVHKHVGNGLTISTCLFCKKSIGSPTPASLRMAEENHHCGSQNRKSK